MFSRLYFMFRNALIMAGVDLYLRTEDRRILEQVIFPYLIADSGLRRILSVGCDWYTRGYNSKFSGKDEYWTMDILPEQRRYGARRHICDSVVTIGRHFLPSSLDLIICNGVFGWGLNERQDVEKAFAGAHLSLRAGGILLVGWNDVPEHKPFPLEQIESLQLFQPYVFPPLKEACFQTATDNRHTYNFYRKQ